MKDLYITDNPEIYKKLNVEYKILLYQIYDWRIIHTRNGEKKIKKIKNKALKLLSRKRINIKSFISDSNYKLIYDLNYLSKNSNVNKISFFNWKSTPLNFNIKDIILHHESYIHRGLLTKINYDQLESLNMIRIEHYILILIINILSRTDMKINIDNIDTNSKILSNLSINNSIENMIDSLTDMYRKNEVNDPFINGQDLSFRFHKESIEDLSKIMYFTDKIIPRIDTLKSLRLLEMYDLVKINKGNITTNIKLSSSDIQLHQPMLLKSNWDTIVKNQDYNYNKFTQLSNMPNNFTCPICASESYRETPTKYFCSDVLCPFSFSKIIKTGGGIKQINERDFKKLLKFNKIITKNNMGGYSHIYLNKFKSKFIPYTKIIKKEKDYHLSEN